jgi:hypothetical protein
MTFYDDPLFLPIARLPFSYFAFIDGLLRLNICYGARRAAIRVKRSDDSSTQPWSQSSDCYERKKAHADIDLAWA